MHSADVSPDVSESGLKKSLASPRLSLPPRMKVARLTASFDGRDGPQSGRCWSQQLVEAAGIEPAAFPLGRRAG